MSGPGIDLEKPNAIGGLDKLVTNFALAVIAVVPTFLTSIIMPWKLVTLLDRDDPDGREGMLLAPGAFFPLALMVSLMVAALLSTPETLSNNGAYIGPGLAVSVQSAASEGDIWKIIATIMPIYGVAIFMGVVGAVLAPVAGPNWSLRVSLRAAFYVTATLTSWMILVTAVVDLIRLSTGSFEIASAIYAVIIIPTAGSVLWMYFWFFRENGNVSWRRSAALSVAMIGLIAAVFLGADFLIRNL